MLGKRIRAARLAARLKQKELAIQSGCSAIWLWKIEKGLERPSLALLLRIAERLGVSIDSLVFGARSARAARPSTQPPPPGDDEDEPAQGAA